MNILKRIFFVLIITISAVKVFAQQDAQFGQYVLDRKSVV